MTWNVTEAVERGCKHLDELRPGWYDSIELDRLNMGDPNLCVCGQLGIIYDGEDEDEDDISMDHNLGFWIDQQFVKYYDGPDYLASTPDEIKDIEAANDAMEVALLARWKEVITERRAAIAI